MATKFVGFNDRQLKTLMADFVEASRLCMCAVNSLLLTPQMQMKQRTKELLQLTFHLSPIGDESWDKVDPIKITYLSFQPRTDRMVVSFDASSPTGNSNTIEFHAFTKSSDPNSVFIRGQYFPNDRRYRALTLIHEHVHLCNPLNPGDGHPGGAIIMFDEGDVGVEYVDAIRNPYCYQYFADWVCP